jgi:hypothetical protein
LIVKQRRNPLKSTALMHILNPHDALRKKNEQELQAKRASTKAATLKAKRKNTKLRAAGK